MKKRKVINKEVLANEGGCCSTPAVSTEKVAASCEQPTDDSSCCDKSESKEMNAEKTGCC